MSRRAMASRRLYASGIKFLAGNQMVKIITTVITRDSNKRITSSVERLLDIHTYVAESMEGDVKNTSTAVSDRRVIMNSFDVEALDVTLNETTCKVRLADGDYTIIDIDRGSYDAMPAAYILTVRK